jgi:hypothetical protein
MMLSDSSKDVSRDSTLPSQAGIARAGSLKERGTFLDLMLQRGAE